MRPMDFVVECAKVIGSEVKHSLPAKQRMKSVTGISLVTFKFKRLPQLFPTTFLHNSVRSNTFKT